jgi:carboxymethylenebutenolidase
MDVQTTMVEVPASGGTMPCFIARPKGDGAQAAVIVIQEAFGLNGHIKDVARRLAAEGYVTLAPDLYWRGGKGRAVGYDQLPEAIALMMSARDDEIVADVKSAVTWLEKQPGVRADRIGISGFCMGGRVSYLAACELPDKIAAAAAFYGGAIPVDKTSKLRAPVLAFFGEKDAFITLDSVEELKKELQRTGKQAEVIVYPGADHGFFCDERASYHEKSAKDAWKRLLDFFGKHLKEK